MKKEKEKLASNFELNIMKIGINIYQLEAGDRFESNGHYFNYYPKSNDNRIKCPRPTGFYSGNHRPSVSAKKFQKQVMKADNIELIQDKVTGVGANGKEHIYKVWEVKYAYKIEIPKHDTLLTLSVSLEWKYADNNDLNKRKHYWDFKTHELEVERITEQNLFLKKSHPVTYHSQIPKTELNIVHTHYSTHYIMGNVEDYAVLEVKLMKAVDEIIKERIKSAEANLQQKKDEQTLFQLFTSQQGYNF